MKTNKIKVLIADDHSVVRTGLTSILGFEKDLTVVGEAADGQQAVERSLKLKPDVVIMDLMMPVLGGVEATARIHAELPETRILVLTTYGTSADIGRAIAAGATGAQMKTLSNDDLVTVIRNVAAGEKCFAPEIMKLLEDEPPISELTARQLEILESVTRGLTNQDIGRMLGISPTAVKQHLSVIFGKLGAASRSEAVAIALRRQLLKI